MLDVFFKYNKNFSIEAHIKLNRMITIAINKICRHKYFNKFYFTDIEKINQYLEQCTLSLKFWFKYLSIYIFINEQSHFTLLDLNRRMVDFDLVFEEKFLKNPNMKTSIFNEYQYPFYKNIPKGFASDNGLDQNPVLLITKNSSNNINDEDKYLKNINLMMNSQKKEKANDKDDFNNSLCLNLYKNLKENGSNSLLCKYFKEKLHFYNLFCSNL